MYNPNSESREVENENRVRKKVVKEKMSRKSLHTIFWIALGVGAILTYLIMLFMGNPFSDIAGKFITGKSLIFVVSTILLWWANAMMLFFASKWYMSDYWYLKHWVSYIVSGAIVTALYIINWLCGLWLLYIVAGLVAIGLFVFLDYYTLSRVIAGINKNTVNDDPLYDEVEE